MNSGDGRLILRDGTHLPLKSTSRAGLLEDDPKHIVGDYVRVVPGYAGLSGWGSHVVISVLAMTVNGEQEYKLRGDDRYERIVPQSQIQSGYTSKNNRP